MEEQIPKSFSDFQFASKRAEKMYRQWVPTVPYQEWEKEYFLR